MKPTTITIFFLSQLSFVGTTTAHLGRRWGSTLDDSMSISISEELGNVSSTISTAAGIQSIAADGNLVDTNIVGGSRAVITHRRRETHNEIPSRYNEDSIDRAEPAASSTRIRSFTARAPDSTSIVFNSTALTGETANIPSSNTSTNTYTGTETPDFATVPPALWKIDYHHTTTPQSFGHVTNSSTEARNYTAPTAARVEDCEFLYRLLGTLPGYWSVTHWNSDWDGRLWGGVVQFAECKFWVVRMDHGDGAVGFGNTDIRNHLRHAIDNYSAFYEDQNGVTTPRVGAIGMDSCRSVGDDGSASGIDAHVLLGRRGEAGKDTEKDTVRSEGKGGNEDAIKASEEGMVEVQWIIYS